MKYLILLSLVILIIFSFNFNSENEDTIIDPCSRWLDIPIQPHNPPCTGDCSDVCEGNYQHAIGLLKLQAYIKCLTTEDLYQQNMVNCNRAFNNPNDPNYQDKTALLFFERQAQEICNKMKKQIFVSYKADSGMLELFYQDCINNCCY